MFDPEYACLSLFNEPPETLAKRRRGFVERRHNNRAERARRNGLRHAFGVVGCSHLRILLEASVPTRTQNESRNLNIRIACIVAIVVGLSLEILRIGAAFSLGTIVAGIGIVVFVYDRMSRPPRR